ncbi:solute carrier family 2, facilitated glucose transporter member 9-like isoform X4 [Hyperolius riggenbachi]|uniref:solute carrier family 2, facilitated glucose transporter member 9-like isoform X4 n=1 Tax=Hyperolius riggenbachi TaxID=752182 RepID=UPI0035A3355A
MEEGMEATSMISQGKTHSSGYSPVAAVSVVPTRKLFGAVCAVGIGGAFQYGYNLSTINAPTPYIQKFINETWYSRYHTQLDEGLLTLIWSVIVSVFTLGGLIGTVIGGYAASMIGISMCVQPLYLGEIAPRRIRGITTVGINIFLTGGILIGQIVGLREMLGAEKYWPLLLATCAIPALIQLISLPCFPESPRYLLIDKKDEYRCQKALKSFYGSLHYKIEMDDIEKESRALNGEKQKTVVELFFDRMVKWQLICIIVMNIGQQLCGINAIYFYAHYVFKKAGIPEENIPYVTLGTGVCECITALTCGLLIDRAGRRVLIIGGYSLMAFWCIMLTITLTYQEAHSWVPYLSMTGVLAFILSFGLGPGGATNTLTAEFFTQSTRAGAFIVAGSVNWTSFFVVGMVFPFIVNGLNQFCFLFFMAVCLAIAIFIYCVVPETKNKSFLDIKEDFQKLNYGQWYKSPQDLAEAEM